MPSPDQHTATPAPVLVLALRRVLRPLVRLMLARGVTLPYLVEWLKALFVEVAEQQCRIDGNSIRVAGTRIRCDGQPLQAGLAPGREVLVSGSWDGSTLLAQPVRVEPTRDGLGAAQLAVKQRLQVTGRVGAERRVTVERLVFGSGRSGSGGGSRPGVQRGKAIQGRRRMPALLAAPVVQTMAAAASNSISKSTVHFVGFACRTCVLSALRLRVHDRCGNGIKRAPRGADQAAAILMSFNRPDPF